MMNKTEQKLIDLAHKHNGAYGIETMHGRGVSCGIRERNALFKLEKKGIVKITDRQQWQDYKRGNCQSGTTFAFELVYSKI